MTATKTTQKNEISLQKDFINLSNEYFLSRASDNPEFKKQFIKTFSDLLFSQNDETLEKLNKTKPASLLNAVFKATEAGASFAKKEVSFIPFSLSKKETVNGVEMKKATGEFEALVVFDINFQKQQILKLENCKRFYTAEVHDGVEVVSDLTTGNFVFDGKNDVTKPTIGYYACFVSTDNQIYDLFMTCSQILERAKLNPNWTERMGQNYKEHGNNIHYEKIVVRNLMKIIPKISKELKSILAWDENSGFSEYEDVTHVNRLEEAKKQLSEKTETKVEKSIIGNKDKFLSELETQKEVEEDKTEASSEEAFDAENFFN